MIPLTIQSQNDKIIDMEKRLGMREWEGGERVWL